MGVRHSEQLAHPHKYAELYVSLEGRTTDVVNGQESKTLPLDVFVLTRDVMHGQINTSDYRYCIFKFDMDALVRRLGEGALNGGFQSIFLIDPALRRDGGGSANMQIDPLTAEYAELAARLLKREGAGEVADELFLSLVLLICKSATVGRGERREARDVVAEAALYMNRHYSECLSLAHLAHRSGYSPRHFARAFGLYLGTSPMKYLTEVRLARAAALLSENKLAITDIASAVGMSDSSTFAKSFRRKFGITPTEYRKSSVRR